MSQLSEISDAELVQRIQKNNSAADDSREAVGILYDRHHERIFRYLWMRLSDHQLAEDLTGEVFIRMVISLPGYKDRALPFQAWLYRIAHNLLIDQYRKNNTRKLVPLEEKEDTLMEEDDLAASVEDQLLIEDVQRALEHIDDLRKDVIVLRFLIGLPIKDVALILDKTIPAIKALQQRGLRDLRLILGNA